MTYADKIRGFKAFPFSKYSNVTSREKLVVFAMQYLEDHEIPLTFNNICIATFKLFPSKFYFSEEFKEYPHIEMLNRTILHLRPVERNYAIGSVKMNYELTELGKQTAEQVRADIENTSSDVKSIKTQVMDSHKKSSENDLQKIKDSDLFRQWLNSSEIDEMAAWGFFEVTPFTQSERIKRQIKELAVYAKSKKDNKVVDFLKELNSKII